MTRANVQVFSGDTDISSNLEVGGNTNISSSLTVTGNTYISSNLTVVGNTYIESDLVLTGNATVTGIVGTSTTGGLNIPYGTSAERPSDPIVGTIRYNTELKYVESYQGNDSWLVITSPPVITNFSPNNVSVDGVPSEKEWDLVQQIEHNDPSPNDYFGHCVDISADGNYLIVGTPYDDTTIEDGSMRTDGGSAKIYIRAPLGDTTPSGTTWSYQATLQEPTTADGDTSAPENSDEFGYSVSLSSDGMYALVGGWKDDPDTPDGDATSTEMTDYGSALVFKRQPDGTWEFMDKLTHENHLRANSSDYAGHSCAMSGDGRYAIVGAYADDPHNALYDYSNDTTVSAGGAAHIFIREASGKWSHQAELTDRNVKSSDNFGKSVDISDDGTYVAVGSPYDDARDSNAGSVHIFKREGTIWTQMVELFDDPNSQNASSSDYFGHSISLSGDAKYLAVGGYSQAVLVPNIDVSQSTTRSDAGKVHMYCREGDEWQREQVIKTFYIDDADANDHFGWDVALSNDGNYLVIGAPKDEHAAATGVNAHGVSHLYRREPSTGGTKKNFNILVSDERVESMWTYVRRLFDTNPIGHRAHNYTSQEAENFGYSVAISGDGKYIANGVPRDHVSVNSSDVADAGTVQLFTANDVSSSNVIALPSTEDQVFTVNGTGFTEGTIVKLIGVDGSLHDVFDMTLTNSDQTQLSFKLGRHGTIGGYDIEKRPYNIKVISDTGFATTSSDTIKLGGRWISPGVDFVFAFDVTNVQTVTLGKVEGVDAAGGKNVTYGVNPATPLPNGLFLNAVTGVVSGQTTTVGTTDVKVRVIDTATQGYEERNIKFVGYDGLYYFNKHTFTPCDQKGRYGPSLAECIVEYGDIVPWNQPSLFAMGTLSNGTSADGFQRWTVPKDGKYEIEAFGARGGDADYYQQGLPGRGAHVKATFSFLKSERIIIIVGQQGSSPHGSSNGASGGGGGTYVIKDEASTSTDDIYLIAGGGCGVTEHVSGQTGDMTKYDAPDAIGNIQGTISTGGASGNNGTGGGGGWSSAGSGSHDTMGQHPFGSSRGGDHYTGSSSSRNAEGGFGGGGGGYIETAGAGGGYRGGRGNHYNVQHPNSSYYGSQSWIMEDGIGAKMSGTGVFLGNHTGNDGKVIVTYIGPTSG